MFEQSMSSRTALMKEGTHVGQETESRYAAERTCTRACRLHFSLPLMRAMKARVMVAKS